MSSFLEIVYSAPFFTGGFVGVIGMKVYQVLYCRHLDKVDPLPNGEKRHVGRFNPTWVGGLLAFAVMGYVLLQVGQTENHYRELGNEMRRCQVEFQTALKTRSAITAENDRLSREQRELLAESSQALSMWVGRLINLPPEIADLPPTDQRVNDYGRTITRIYFERAGKINDRIKQISDRQQELDAQRAANPLPEPSCGK